MSKSDIMLQIAFLGQLILFFYAFFSLKNEVSRIKQRLRELDIVLSSINVALTSMKSDIENSKTDIKRFDEKGFNNLHNRITEASTQYTELDHKVRQLDASLKGFYSTWARKLGILSQKQEKEEAEKLEQEFIPELPEAPQLPNQIPIQPRKRGWQRMRRG